MSVTALKTAIAQRFKTLYFFYTYMGKRLLLLLIFNFLMAFLDSVGLIMFVPLLQIADNPEGVEDGNKLLEMVTGLFEFLHLPLNVYTLLILIAVIFTLKAVAKYFAQFFQTITLQTFVKKIRKNLIDGLSNLSYKEFVSADVGRIQNTLTVEAQNVAIASWQYIESIKSGMLVAVYLGFAFTIDWQFSILIVIGGGLTNFVYKRFYDKTRNLSRSITRNNHRFGGSLIESVNNFKYLKASGRNQNFGKKLNKELNDWIYNNIKIGKLKALIESIREPMMVFIVVVVISLQVGVFKAPLGAILIVLVLFYRAMTYIMNMQTTWNSFLANYGSLENVMAFTDYLRANAEAKSGSVQLEKIETIEWRNMNLSFGDFKVLNDIDLKIRANESIAFVGESGSGKSTLVNVLCGVLEFDAGTFLVNGIPIEELDRNHFKGKIGYISQEPTIFNADIFDNVTFWAERTEENIVKFYEVMEKASMKKFLKDLPNGYEELLGHNGMNISGGQKQRISIARELYKDVELLIMDEATSALDSETENEIRESLESLQGQLTIVSIAHRLSTIQAADSIYLMEKGKIVAAGDFETLKNKSQYFEKLAVLQGL